MLVQCNNETHLCFYLESDRKMIIPYKWWMSRYERFVVYHICRVLPHVEKCMPTHYLLNKL